VWQVPWYARGGCGGFVAMAFPARSSQGLGLGSALGLGLVLGLRIGCDEYSRFAF